MRRIALLLPFALSFPVFAQDPVIALKATDAFPIEMPSLMPYALWAGVNVDEPATLTAVVFSVDGNVLPTVESSGAYLAWWTPLSYGSHLVEVTATASNGNSSSQSAVVEVSASIADRTALTMDGAVIDWPSLGSQWFTGDFVLPQSVGAYDRITAHLNVTCPSVAGGCDDWDRLASVEARAPNGEWVEIIRYITPYGVPCDHSLDVTDFASLLQGNTPIRMYIDTWGTGGWKMDLEFTYEAGTPDYAYTTVQTVWRGTYPFGNPADLQPVDTVSMTPPEGTQSASMRLVTTGHGWGGNNTGNAAEFYHAVHHVNVNGSSFTQNLWTDCNPNPDACSPQSGTWQYDRAGWCPGSIARPFSYDLDGLLGTGPLECAYTFQESYVDNCHPNNPNCVSGSTCADCNDGYNPYYPVSCYLISRSGAPISTGVGDAPVTRPAAQLRVSPNPADDQFRLHLDHDLGPVVVTVHDVSDKALRTWFVRSVGQLNGQAFDVSRLAAGTYFVKVQGEREQAAATLVVR